MPEAGRDLPFEPGKARLSVEVGMFSIEQPSHRKIVLRCGVGAELTEGQRQVVMGVAVETRLGLGLHDLQQHLENVQGLLVLLAIVTEETKAHERVGGRSLLSCEPVESHGTNEKLLRLGELP